MTAHVYSSVLLAALTACGTSSSGSADGGTEDALVDHGFDAQNVDAGATSFRVATVNLHCLLDEWDQRAVQIVEELAELTPDVIAFQEVCRQDNGVDALNDLLGLLVAATDETYQSARVETHLAWDQYHEGIALLSRHPMDNLQTVDLPGGLFPRKAIVARIHNDLAPLQVAVTHLSFGDQEAVRSDQLGALRTLLQTRRVENDTLIIAGDLNEGPAGNAVEAALGADYQDTWGELHPNEDGSTYPSSLPTSRIDYILMSSPTDGLQAKTAQRFLQAPIQGRFASDHFALWTELGRE